MEFEQAWPSFCTEAEKKMRWMFFFDYLSFYLKHMGIHGSPFVYGANILFQAYDSYSFNRRIRRFGRTPSNRIFSLTSPLQNIYLATAAVLYSIGNDGSVDETLLARGADYLKRVFQLPDQDGAIPGSWRQARDACLEAQKLYFIREQKRGL